MGIKQVTGFLIFFLCMPCLSAQWKEEVAWYLGERKDHAGAVDYLREHLEKIDETDRSAALGLLSFCSNKLGLEAEENRWIAEYFDAFQGIDAVYGFLDWRLHAEIIEFLRTWRRQFPLIMDIALIESETDRPSPPGRLILAVDILNDGYYRLSLGGVILKGGLLRTGENTLNIDADGFFRESGSHLYHLDVKIGGRIFRKNIEIEVELGTPRPAEREIVSRKPEEKEYRLSMFVDGELIISSKKLKAHLDGLMAKLDIPATKAPYIPDYPLKRNDPMINSASILDALALAYQAIKELRKDKSRKDHEPLKLKKTQEIRVTFVSGDADGTATEVRGVIRLKSGKMKVLGHASALS